MNVPTAMQAAMPIKDMATTTGAFGFTRTLAGTIGISVGNAIYSSELAQRLPKIPGVSAFTSGRSVQELANDVKGLTKIEVSFFIRELDVRKQC
jgi:hypothetical protein